MAEKADGAFLTISELADSLGLPQHILRYWETRFSQLRPLQRAGKRRYYRPDDVALAQRIDRLLNQEGYTIKGVQKVLAQKGGNQDRLKPASYIPSPVEKLLVSDSQTVAAMAISSPLPPVTDVMPELKRLRAVLAQALVTN